MTSKKTTQVSKVEGALEIAAKHLHAAKTAAEQLGLVNTAKRIDAVANRMAKIVPAKEAARAAKAADREANKAAREAGKADRVKAKAAKQEARTIKLRNRLKRIHAEAKAAGVEL